MAFSNLILFRSYCWEFVGIIEYFAVLSFSSNTLWDLIVNVQSDK